MLPLSELMGQKQQRHSYHRKQLAAVSSCLVLLLTTTLLLGNVPMTTGITLDILSFAPTVIGMPLHITYTFTPQAIIPASTWIEIALPGMTTGQIQCEKGYDIGSVIDLMNVILESSPPLLWVVSSTRMSAFSFFVFIHHIAGTDPIHLSQIWGRLVQRGRSKHRICNIQSFPPNHCQSCCISSCDNTVGLAQRYKEQLWPSNRSYGVYVAGRHFLSSYVLNYTLGSV